MCRVRRCSSSNSNRLWRRRRSRRRRRRSRDGVCVDAVDTRGRRGRSAVLSRPGGRVFTRGSLPGASLSPCTCSVHVLFVDHRSMCSAAANQRRDTGLINTLTFSRWGPWTVDIHCVYNTVYINHKHRHMSKSIPGADTKEDHGYIYIYRVKKKNAPRAYYRSITNLSYIKDHVLLYQNLNL